MAFGNGIVYMTELHPSKNTWEEILKNNWVNLADRKKHKMECLVMVKIPKEKQAGRIEKEPDTDRNVLKYDGDLNLDDYKWAFGTFEE